MKSDTTIGVWVLIGLMVGCAAPAEESIAGQRVTTRYMSVKAPETGAWFVQTKSDTEVTFWSGEVGDTLVASVRLFRFGSAETPEEYEKLVRDGAAKEQRAYPDRYRLLEESAKYTAERSYPCVGYRSVLMDNRAKGTKAAQFLELDNLYCRHPADPSIGAVISYSHRGLSRYANLRAEAEAFIQNATLPEE